MKHLLTRSAKIILEILLFTVLVFAIALGVARLFFPHLNHYKPYFEEWASTALHQPVKITHIQASWRGLHPLVNMEQVDILDATSNQPHLHIQRLQVGAQVIASLLERRFIPSSITVFGTQIQAQRIDANTFSVNGINIPITKGETPGADVGNIIGWLLNQGNIRLENIDLDWKDQNGRLFQLSNLTAGLEHGFFKNQVIGAATLLEKVPARFRFVINITQIGPNPRQIRANCYLFIKNFELTPWLKDLPVPEVDLTQGRLDRLQLWAVWENNQWQQLQSVFRLQQAQLTTRFLDQPLNLDALNANIAWQRRADGFSFAADQIKLQVNQQLWPVTQLSLQQAQASDTSKVQMIKIDSVDLEQVNNLVSRLISPSSQTLLPPREGVRSLPSKFLIGGADEGAQIQHHPLSLTPNPSPGGRGELPSDQWKSYLNALQPQGKLEHLLIRRETPATGEALLSASTDFTALTTQAWHNLPAINGLQGKVQLTPTAGDLQLDGHALDLNAPAWFSHPFHLDLYQGRIQWIKLADGFNIQANNLTFADDNLGARADLELWLPQQPGDTPYMQFLAAFSERDSAHLRDYIPTGILKTHAALATWLTNAFVAGDGAEGQIVLQGPLSHFPFDDHTGRFGAAVTVKNMQFNYKTGWPQINHLNAQALFDGRSLTIEATPGATILGATADVIKAQIPDLAHAELAVQGNNIQGDMQQGLRFIAQSPLQKTIGEGLENLALQGDMKLDLGLHIPLHTGGVASTVRGNVLVSPDSKLDVPAWKIHLTDFEGGFGFTENSLSADKLTAKWLGQPVNIHIDTQAATSDHVIQAHIKGHTTIAAIEKEYGLKFLKNKLSGETDYSALLQLSRKQGHPETVFSIDSNLQGVAIDLPEPLKKTADEKLPAHAETKTLEKSTLSIFLQYAKRLNATLAFAQNAQKSWVLKQGDIAFNAETPSAFGAALASARIQIRPETKAWTVKINSPNVQGDLIIPDNFSSTLVGNFQRFRVMPGGVSKTVGGINPGDIPPLNLQFQNFYYGDRPFGAVALLTSSEKSILQIQRLKIDAADTHILATGRWQQSNTDHQQTTISGNLKSDNIGAALKTWQVTSSVVNGHGHAAFALSWPAAAYDFSSKELNGSLSLAFNKGSIINISDEKTAEMGIGRILNLLSLQSIPRRLTFDFSDLLQKGFAFDVMKGEFNIQNGNALTDNAYLDGPIAKVEIKGRIGMANKDYDLLMMTTPYITSSLPIAATIVGGPIAGAATWLGSKVFSGVVNSMTMHTYKVSGPWDKPVVETAGSAGGSPANSNQK